MRTPVTRIPIIRAYDGSLERTVAPTDSRSGFDRRRAAAAKTASLRDAALLAFYTDGLTEATRDIEAGERRLREALATDALFYVANPAEFLEHYTLHWQTHPMTSQS